MSTKLKIILGTLLLIAGFFVVRLGLYFKNSIQTANSIKLPSVLSAEIDNPLEQDSDSDGVTDRDEIIYGLDAYKNDTDGDGYLDGEEIASGYDPSDPSANSKSGVTGVSLMSPTANLTDRLLNLTIASIINDSGDIDPAQVSEKQYADILQSIGNEGALSIYLPPPTDADMKIITDNSSETVQKYLKSISFIVEGGLFSSTGGILLGVEGISNKDSTYYTYYENAYYSLKAVEVPSNWKEIHRAAMLTFAQLASSFKILRNLDEDPLRASFALNQTQDSFLQLLNILNQASRLAKSENIPTDDSILQLVQSAGGYLPTAR